VNTGPYAALLVSFNENWRDRKPEFELQITDGDLANAEAHPLCGELLVLCSKRAASLPYFGDEDIIWYTLAPGSNELRQAVVALRAWILPSFGGEKPGDGFVQHDGLRSRQGALLSQGLAEFLEDLQESNDTSSISSASHSRASARDDIPKSLNRLG
jgi:hypothetical protein